MARSIWTGAIAFGLVNVPVKLYSATEERTVRFRQLQAGTGKRIHYQRVAEGTDEEVPYEDIVKGYEMDKGRYVMIEPDELDAVSPEKTRAIDIEDFVELAAIDPIYFQKTYYLGPDGPAATRPYTLLREAMARSGRVAIGRFVMRSKEYLAAIRPAGEVLVLETMFFADEVRSPEIVGDLPTDVDIADRELRIASQLIDSLTSDFEPDRYRDTHRERVLEMVERKAKGEDVVVAAPEVERPEKVVDLLAVLERSVEEARQRRAGRRAPGAPPKTEEERQPRVVAAKAASGDGLEERSKEELYEEAQERDIPGRSKMSKDELVDALRQAS